MVPYAECWSPLNSRITSHPVSGCRDLEVRPLGGDRGGHEGSAVMGATSELMRGPRGVRCPPPPPVCGGTASPSSTWGAQCPPPPPGGMAPLPSTRGVRLTPPHAGGTARCPWLWPGKRRLLHLPAREVGIRPPEPNKIPWFTNHSPRILLQHPRHQGNLWTYLAWVLTRKC